MIMVRRWRRKGRNGGGGEGYPHHYHHHTIDEDVAEVEMKALDVTRIVV